MQRFNSSHTYWWLCLCTWFGLSMSMWQAISLTLLTWTTLKCHLSKEMYNDYLQNIIITYFIKCHNMSSDWISLYANIIDISIFVIMPPPLGAGGIMFSGCPSVRPSVRSLKYPLLTCTWVRWSTRPTVTVLRHVRPSVCPSVRLSVRPSGEVYGQLPENAWREWPQIWHADVSWPSSELINLWPRSVDFSNFGAILT